MKQAYVYILASGRNGTLYIGVTNDIARRIHEHKNDNPKSFTSRYKVHTLVYCEAVDTIMDAIKYEKAMKKWKREWKIALIEKSNPDWRDILAEGAP